MTRTTTIPGTLDLAAADLHRPDDSESLAAEVRRLRRAGHSALFISEALRLDPVMVANVLRGTP